MELDNVVTGEDLLNAAVQEDAPPLETDRVIEEQETLPDEADSLIRELESDLEKAEAEPKKDQPEPPDERFDKHPRFQKLHQQKMEADARARMAEEQMQRLQWQMQQFQAMNRPQNVQPQPRGLADMTNEEISTLMLEDPREYTRLLDLAMDQKTQQATVQAQQAAVQEHQKNLWFQHHPEFPEAIQSKELEKFLARKAAETGIQFDPITGFYEMRLEATKAGSFKEGYQKALSDLKAKRAAGGQLGSGGTPADRASIHESDIKNLTPEQRRQRTIDRVRVIRQKSGSSFD